MDDLTTTPEPGQLVEVRGQRYVVTNVDRSNLEPDPLSLDKAPAQHLVELSSLAEDGLGEELSVIWEIEPGARVFERIELPEPTGFDDPARLDAFITAVRWGAIQSVDAANLHAPFRAGISVVDYQLDPVVRALQMPRANLLIADDVGLGKTIEAGLVAQELILRQRVRSILVVCPASLLVKWRDEMLEKFGLEFRIVDSELMRDLRRRRGIHANPWTHFPRLITSIDYLKRERPMRLFRECLPGPNEPAWPRRFDLLIVDEAHNVAPSGRGRYATDSDRTLAIRTLAPHFEHRLFLTATPHNGYSESFSALLNLLDDQRFAPPPFKPDEKQLKTVMVHRLKSEIVNPDGTPKFPERCIEAIEVPYSDKEREAYANLLEYGALRAEAMKEKAKQKAEAKGRKSNTTGETQKTASDFVFTLLKKRMFSCPASFRHTLERHRKTLAGIKDAKTPRRRPAPGILKRQLESVGEEHADDEFYEEHTDDILDLATEQLADVSPEESKLLRDLHDWATQASAKPDSKARKLIEWLKDTLQPGGDWNNERVIIFTEYRATQKWLHERLAAEGMASDGRLETMYGGMDSDDRERIKAAFQTDPTKSKVRILLATDSASEGIDLQRWCHRVIHYEIPWNPMRLEQRNGRVDRHGQRASEVLVHHFVGEGWEKSATKSGSDTGSLEGDLEFLVRAAKKVDTIRRDLGKVGPVIASQIEEAMLGHRSRLETDQAEREATTLRKQYAFERNLRERVAELSKRLEDSRRDLRVTPETVRSVVEVGLSLTRKPPLKEAKLDGVWPDPSGTRTSCPVFQMPKLDGSWAKCAIGLTHPHTGEIRPITFDHEIATDRDDVVLVHLEHPLVRMCQGLLRSEVWAKSESKNLHRVTARMIDDGSLDRPAIVAHARLVVLGGDGQRLHEQIITAGGRITEGRFARMNVSETDAASAAGTDASPDTKIEEHLLGLWPRIAEPLHNALEARMRDRTKNLEKRFEELANSEVEKFEAILDELERGIREQLTAEPPAQRELFSEDESLQYERNKESLQRRLESLPAEREREVAEIRRRYSDPDPRMFPVAATFLVPSGWKP